MLVIISLVRSYVLSLCIGFIRPFFLSSAIYFFMYLCSYFVRSLCVSYFVISLVSDVWIAYVMYLFSNVVSSLFVYSVIPSLM